MLGGYGIARMTKNGPTRRRLYDTGMPAPVPLNDQIQQAGTAER